MSVSSIHHHFKGGDGDDAHAISKQLRLQEVRRLMLAERVDVGTAGYAVAIKARRSSEHSRIYGKPPLRDVGGLRLAAAG
jgi:hypothetical protein